MRVLQRRPLNRVEVWSENRYLHVFAAAGGPVIAAVENRGSVDAPDVRLSFLAGCASAETRRRIERSVRRILGLDVDPAPLLRAAERVRRLRGLARSLRGMRPPRFATLFDTFANVVPFQQLSLDAGTAIVGRLVERFGEHVEHDALRIAAFPTAAAIGSAGRSALLACGLSRTKADALRHVARAIDAGDLSEDAIARLATNEALKVLTALPGIGPWSAALVLLRGFGRLDVFPPGDSGVQRALDTLLALRAPSLATAIERFAEHRGYLYLFGLGGSLLAKGLIHAAPAPRRGSAG